MSEVVVGAQIKKSTLLIQTVGTFLWFVALFLPIFKKYEHYESVLSIFIAIIWLGFIAGLVHAYQWHSIMKIAELLTYSILETSYYEPSILRTISSSSV